jgi:hypothetical protein
MNKKIKFAVAFLAVFIFGIWIGSAGQEEKVVERVIEKEVGKSYQSELKELKALDDQVIVTASQGLNACAEILDAASRFDVQAMEKPIDEIIKLTPVMGKLIDQRKEFIVSNGL